MGELHATFVDSKPGGGRALPLVALLVAQPLAPLVALLSVVRTKRVRHPILDDVWPGGLWWVVLEWGGTARRVAVPSLSVLLCCGGVLLSHNLSVAVPLALPGLASRFGMVLGVSPVL